jgi:lactoylglutathione lyase
MPEFTLGWVIVYVDEPSKAAAFYSDTFGFATKADFGEYAEVDTGSTTLAFAAYTLSEQNFPGGVGRAQAGEQPGNVEIALVTTEVDEAFDLARAAGCKALADPADKPQGQRVAYVRDPFGTLVELATPL